jgi:hypothetical protein
VVGELIGSSFIFMPNQSSFWASLIGPLIVILNTPCLTACFVDIRVLKLNQCFLKVAHISSPDLPTFCSQANNSTADYLNNVQLLRDVPFLRT